MKLLNRAASTFNASAVATAGAALFLAAAAFHGSAQGQTRDADRQKQSTTADAVLAPASGPQSSPSGTSGASSTSGAAEAAGGAAATVTEKLKEAGKEVAETTRRVVRLIAEKLPGTKTQTDDGASADAKVIREGDSKAGSKGATSGSTSSDDQKK